MSKIVVVGGGAAGLLCAAKSAEKGNDVIIIEKMNRCGRKLMITGKGRCNVTNASFELDDFKRAYKPTFSLFCIFKFYAL